MIVLYHWLIEYHPSRRYQHQVHHSYLQVLQALPYHHRHQQQQVVDQCASLQCSNLFIIPCTHTPPPCYHTRTPLLLSQQCVLRYVSSWRVTMTKTQSLILTAHDSHNSTFLPHTQLLSYLINQSINVLYYVLLHILLLLLSFTHPSHDTCHHAIYDGITRTKW